MAEITTKAGSRKIVIDVEDYARIRSLVKRIRDTAPQLSGDTILQRYLADSIENKARYIDVLLTVGQRQAAGTAEGNYGSDPDVHWIRLKSSDRWHIGELTVEDELTASPEVFVRFLDGDGSPHLMDELNIDTMVTIPPPAILAGAFKKEAGMGKTSPEKAL